MKKTSYAIAGSAVVLIVMLVAWSFLKDNEVGTNGPTPTFDRSSPPLVGSLSVENTELIKPDSELRDVRPVRWYRGYISDDGRYFEVWLTLDKECEGVASIEAKTTDSSVLAVLFLGLKPIERGSHRVCADSRMVRVWHRLERAASPGLPVLNGLEHGFTPEFHLSQVSLIF